MTIKAIIRDGRIQPLEPLPPGWTEGQQLKIEEPDSGDSTTEVAAWARELETSTSRIPANEHESLDRALQEIERESKEAVRKEWGLE